MPFELHKEKEPRLTYLLMGVIVALYFYEGLVYFLQGGAAERALIENFGFSLQGLLQGRWWTVFTSIFLHGGVEHIVVNLLALYFFGRAVEGAVNWKKYLAIFFASALVGDLVISLTALLGVGSASIPTIGASAAIFGLMGGAMIMRPFNLVFYPYIIPVPLILVAVLYTAFNFIAFFATLGGLQSNIAYGAHIGGIIAGAAFGFREAGMRKGLQAAAVIIVLLIVLPFVLQYLNIIDYSRFLTGS